TGPTMMQFATYAPIHDSNYQNFIILLTDGQPTCGDGLGGAAISASTSVKAAGVPGIGVGFDLTSGDINPHVLNTMATAGGMPRPDPAPYRFYAANDLSGLSDVLKIVGTEIKKATVNVEKGCANTDPGAGGSGGNGSGGSGGNGGSGGSGGSGVG